MKNKKEGNIGFVERQNAKGKQIASFFRFGNQVQECIFFSLFRLDRCRVILAANLMHSHWVYWRLIPVFVFNISVAHYSIPGMLYQRRQRKRPSFISTSPSNVQIRRKKKTNKFYPIFAMLHWCMRVRACVFFLYMYHTMVNKWKPMFLFFLHTFESRWSNVFPLEAHSQRWCIIITNTICWGGGGKKSGTVFFGILLPDEE